MSAAAPPSASEPSPPDRAYIRSLFDWFAPSYNSALASYTLGQDLRWKWELVHRLDPHPGDRVLDLASGTGLIYDRLARAAGIEHVVGLDINPVMLEVSRRADPARRLVRADVLHLPFPDATFDIVSAGYLFKYVPLASLTREIRRVLRPGGRFGGYDFSAPTYGSFAGDTYAVYLHRVLPAVGRRFSGGDEGWARLFDFLDRIANSSGWEARAPTEFAAAGFADVRQVTAIGGAVTWLWARVPGTDPGTRPAQA